MIEKLESMKLARAATIVREGVLETLSYMNFAREHRRCIKTNKPLERLNRDERRRTRVVRALTDGQPALPRGQRAAERALPPGACGGRSLHNVQSQGSFNICCEEFVQRLYAL